MMKPKRSGATIQMHCNECRKSCSPRDGDWHEGAKSQVFYCRGCEKTLRLRPVRPFAYEPVRPLA